MATTSNKLGNAIGLEGRTIYVNPEDRFVVTLAVGYSTTGGVNTPLDAVACALGLTTDQGSEGTVWFVYDRKTGEHHTFDQGEAYERLTALQKEER